MSKISNRLMSLSRSATLAMNQKSREMIREDIDVINLSIGESDFDTPDHIKEAAIQAIHDNFTHYPPVPGFLDLREAISIKLKRDNALDYSSNEIIVSNGGKQAIANAMLCLLNPDDEVLIPAPYWVSYPEIVKLAEGKSKGQTKISDCEDMAMYLLNEAHVATVSGAAFGVPESIRFSYATSTEILEKGLDRIQKALRELK